MLLTRKFPLFVLAGYRSFGGYVPLPHAVLRPSSFVILILILTDLRSKRPVYVFVHDYCLLVSG